MPTAGQIYYTVSAASFDPRRQGPPLVLLHGAGGTHLHWPAQLRHLKSAQVYSIDLPGHGHSEGVGRQSVAAYAEAIVTWMGECALEKAVLTGSSMGGAIALWIALTRPERVVGLVLVGTGARLRVAEELLEGTSLEGNFSRAVNQIIDWSFARDTPRSLKETAARRMRQTRFTVLHGDFLACDGFDVISELGKIRGPALIICGQEDRMTPMKYSRFLAERLADAELVEVPQAGHMVMLEQPVCVTESIRAFVQKRWPSPPDAA
jgi:pimeloyl-ACP methyl ester carboxylesterase